MKYVNNLERMLKDGTVIAFLLLKTAKTRKYETERKFGASSYI